MDMQAQAAIGQALCTLIPAGVEFDVRAIDPEYRRALLPAEAELTACFCASRTDEFATGRSSLRHLLQSKGVDADPILVGSRREPILPSGVVASISHSECTVVSVLASDDRFAGIGVDIENRLRMSADLEAIIIDRIEKAALPNHVAPLDWLAMHFSAKESVFKSIYRIIGHYIQFTDIRLSFSDESFVLQSHNPNLDLTNVAVSGAARIVGDMVVSAAWASIKRAR